MIHPSTLEEYQSKSRIECMKLIKPITIKSHYNIFSLKNYQICWNISINIHSNCKTIITWSNKFVFIYIAKIVIIINVKILQWTYINNNDYLNNHLRNVIKQMCDFVINKIVYRIAKYLLIPKNLKGKKSTSIQISWW